MRSADTQRLTATTISDSRHLLGVTAPIVTHADLVAVAPDSGAERVVGMAVFAAASRSVLEPSGAAVTARVKLLALMIPGLSTHFGMIGQGHLRPGGVSIEVVSAALADMVTMAMPAPGAAS